MAHVAACRPATTRLGRLTRGRPSSARQQVAQALAWPVVLAVIVVVGGMASWIAWRRWSGHGHAPSAGLLVATGFAETVFLVVLHEWQRVSGGGRLTCQTRRGHLALTGVAVLLAAALSFPEAPTPGVVALWSLLAVAETWWWGRYGGTAFAGSADSTGRRSERRDPSPVMAVGIGTAPRSPLVVVEQATAAEDEAAADEEPDESGPLLQPGVVQQWTRGADASCGEWIEAFERVVYQADQRHAIVHMAFCPALGQAPEVAAEVVEGVPAEVVVAQIRPYGVRLELRVTSRVAPGESSLLFVRVNR